MNLMNMVRLCGLVVIGWTLMALGVGMWRSDSRPAQDASFFLPKPALHEAVAVNRSELPGLEEYRLFDRSTGRVEPLPLPDDANWGFVSVSPWRDQEGNLEAVGRWNRREPGGEGAFFGLGLFSLSDTSVVHSVDLNVLPTGKPCWIPGRPGDVLFPAADGRLHRCHLTRGGVAHEWTDDQEHTHASSARPFPSHPVTWRCTVPGSGRVFIADPVWPCEQQLRKFVFASLSRQSLDEGKPRNGTPQIWWLEMSERGDEILSAGRLTESSSATGDIEALVERSPSVAVGPSRRLTLAYLTRARGETSWRLCLAALFARRTNGQARHRPAPVTGGQRTKRPPRDGSHVLDRRAVRLRLGPGRTDQEVLPGVVTSRPAAETERQVPRNSLRRRRARQSQNGA